MGVKDTLDSEGLHPRKRWGQHFLTDPRILASIVEAAGVSSTDTVLEIGPGLGHLTRVLAARAGRVVAVEVDPELASKLENDFAKTPNVAIVRGNVLDHLPIEWLSSGAEQIAGAGDIPASLSKVFKVVANLPYYITSAILRYLLDAAVKPSAIVVMVQRQVAQRMVAQPPEMNLLAVSVQFFARVRLIRTIAPGAFYPRPKVESAVVRLDVMEPPPLGPKETGEFFRLVRAGFGERRKQLRNSLARGLGLSASVAESLLARAQIAAVRRAETLTLPEWQELYREWVRWSMAKRLPED